MGISKVWHTFILIFLFIPLIMGCTPREIEGFLDESTTIPASLEVAPTYLKYAELSNRSVYYGLVDEIVSFDPPLTDGEKDIVYSADPALPSGLSLNPLTGEISGSVPSTTLNFNAIIYATNSKGSAALSVQFHFIKGYRVDVSTDGSDDDGGADDTCFSTPSTGCSLRAAIETANNNAGLKLILIDSPVSADNFYTITDDLIISGAESKSISPTTNNSYRMISYTTAGISLTLDNLTIDGFGSTGINGGVVYSTAANTLIVNESAFSNNIGADSAVFHLYGGINADIQNSIFLTNTASSTGGVFDAGGATTTISLNNVYGEGNSAAWGSFGHICTGTNTSITNSTFYGNISSTHGLFAVCTGKYIFNHVTAINNTNTSSTGAPGIYLHSSSSQLDISNSIFAFNTDSDGDDRGCHINSGTPTLTSYGGNYFAGAETSCSAYLNHSNDHLNTDPMVITGGGVDNGGLVPTILLQTNSPAIDGGETSQCLTSDARSFSRPIDYLGGGALCDAGAVEMSSLEP